MKGQSNKRKSINHEKRLSKELSARLTVNSGASNYNSQKADMNDENYKYEVKTFQKNYTIKPITLSELTRYARLSGRCPALVLTFEGLSNPIPRDWVCIPLAEFKSLIADGN
jgi:hypothetical protein